MIYRCSHDPFRYCGAVPDDPDAAQIGEAQVSEDLFIRVRGGACRLSPATCGHCRTADQELRPDAEALIEHQRAHLPQPSPPAKRGRKSRAPGSSTEPGAPGA